MKSYMFDTTVVLESIIIDRTVLFSKRKKKKKKRQKNKDRTVQYYPHNSSGTQKFLKK